MENATHLTAGGSLRITVGQIGDFQHFRQLTGTPDKAVGRTDGPYPVTIVPPRYIWQTVVHLRVLAGELLSTIVLLSIIVAADPLDCRARVPPEESRYRLR